MYNVFKYIYTVTSKYLNPFTISAIPSPDLNVLVYFGFLKKNHIFCFGCIFYQLILYVIFAEYLIASVVQFLWLYLKTKQGHLHIINELYLLLLVQYHHLNHVLPRYLLN